MARTALQIIKSALGDPDFSSAERDPTKDVDGFQFFRINLSGPRYRGIPSQWYAGILPEADRPIRRDESAALLTSAGQFIRNILGHKLEPLLVLCDDPSITLANDLLYERRNVFILDRDQLPSSAQAHRLLRTAPFMGAVRQKLSKHALSALFFEPYRPGEPVDGWRFFGRKHELDRLVNTNQSFLVVGARYIGKSSLLKEAARQLRQTGTTVYQVPLQYCDSAAEVVSSIVRTLSAREAEAAVRRQKAVNEPLLESVLKAVSRENTRVTLILDELGNAIRKARRDDWNIMGTLREYSQRGKIQVIASGFQEFFLKQIEDPRGPFINFGDIMKLGVFSDNEVEEFLVEPLDLWGSIRDHATFRQLIVQRAGRQPLFLQFLGRALFGRIFERPHRDLETALEALLTSPNAAVFEGAIDAVFYRAAPPVVRFLFLQRCREAEMVGEDVRSVEFTDEWVKKSLKGIGRESDFGGRRLLLESMEMLGLTSAISGSRSRQAMQSSVIWQTVRGIESNIDDHIRTFAEEVNVEETPLIVGSSLAG